MNKEFERRLQAAEDAADVFCKAFVETGDLAFLENDKETQELYLKALDVAEVRSNRMADSSQPIRRRRRRNVKNLRRNCGRSG